MNTITQYDKDKNECKINLKTNVCSMYDYKTFIDLFVPILLTKEVKIE